MAAEEKEIESQGAVSFMVNFNDVPSKPRRLPKGLAARREQQQAKASLTEQTIAEKQKRAEERRQKLKEEKLERLHQLEEEMAGLARKMHAQEEASQNSSNSLPSASSFSSCSSCPSSSTDLGPQTSEAGTSNHVTNNGVGPHK